MRTTGEEPNPESLLGLTSVTGRGGLLTGAAGIGTGFEGLGKEGSGFGGSGGEGSGKEATGNEGLDDDISFGDEGGLTAGLSAKNGKTVDNSSNRL
jgi:hypothetical protein